MPVATYKHNGTYACLQWTGSNLSEVQSTFTNTYDVFTSPTDNTNLIINGHGTGGLSSPQYVPQNYWFVSNVAYSPNTPTLSNGAQLVDPSTFTQQYSLA